MNPIVSAENAADAIYRYVALPAIAGKMQKQLVNPISNIVHPVSVNVKSKDMERLIKTFASGTEKPEREAGALVLKGFIDGVKVKDGKVFFRNPDNSLVRDKSLVRYFDEAVAAPDGVADDVKQLNEFVFGRSHLYDKLGNPRHVEFVPTMTPESVVVLSSELSHAADAARKVGIKRVPDVVINRTQPRSFFPKVTSSYDYTNNQVVLDAQAPGDAYHELSHAKDAESKLVRTIIPANMMLNRAALIGFPVAYVAGDEIAEALPGEADNRVIDFVKKWGPEVYLASAMANTLGNEYRTYKKTKKYLQDEFNNDYSHVIRSLPKEPNLKPGDMKFPARALDQKTSIDNLIKHHQLALGTYFAKPAIYYGAMRGGAYAYDEMNKKSSPLTNAIARPFEDIYYSFRRGIESAKDFPLLFKSMLMSSPSAPTPSVPQMALIAGIPIGAAYLIGARSEETPLRAAAIDNIKENML